MYWVGYVVTYPAVLYCCFALISGVPALLKCLGKRQNGQIHYEVSPNITGKINHCEAQWIVKEKVVALYEGNGNISFKFPVISATANKAIMKDDSDKLEYHLICPDINVHRRLTCSYLALDYTATRDPPPGNQMLTDGFPNWGIAVIVIVGILCLSGIIMLVYKKRKRGYVPTDKNEPD